MGQHDPRPDGAPDGLLAMAGAVYPDGFSLETLGTQALPAEAATTTIARARTENR
jgi:hypothetical protein